MIITSTYEFLAKSKNNCEESWQRLCGLVGEMIEPIRSADQLCRMEFPGTIRILQATERIRINTQYMSKSVILLPALNEEMHSGLSHLCGIRSSKCSRAF